MTQYNPEFLSLLNSVTAKRPRTVIQHILKYGYITTEELKSTYGYNHPPRAVRDVKEHGIPIERFTVKGNDGRSIAAYRFGNQNEICDASTSKRGRTVLSSKIKKKLLEKYGARCFIYMMTMPPEQLQIDHRVPYEIGGEADQDDIENFMLLSPSANRAKSWTCEHCDNWHQKDVNLCKRCFWAHPERYEHVAGRKERIVSLIFSDDEAVDYQKLLDISENQDVATAVKKLLHDHLIARSE